MWCKICSSSCLPPTLHFLCILCPLGDASVPLQTDFLHTLTFSLMCECFCLDCRYVCHVHAVPKEARRGHSITWSWSYRRLYWVLRTEPKPSARAGSSLNHGAISPAPLHVNLDVAFVSVPPLPLYHVTTDKRPLTHQELMKPIVSGKIHSPCALLRGFWHLCNSTYQHCSKVPPFWNSLYILPSSLIFIITDPFAVPITFLWQNVPGHIIFSDCLLSCRNMCLSSSMSFHRLPVCFHAG